MAKASFVLNQAKTPLECLDYWAQETPAQSALTVLNANGDIVKTYTFSTLYDSACYMAVWLGTKVKRGDRVVLLFENTASFAISFLACLRLGVIAVPAPLRIDPRRIANIVADCDPRLALYEEIQDGQASTNWQEGLGTVPISAVPTNPDGKSFNQCCQIEDIFVGADEPAVLQYTSGTTSTPKGVVVSQANVMTNFRLLYDAVDMDQNAIVVSWLPVFHDMGLFGGLLQAPLGGGHSILLPRTTTLRNPLRWLEVISHFRATHSGAPNFAFDACVDALARGNAPDLDLSSWRVAWNAAEPVQARTLVNFAHAFAPFGLRAEAQCPIYGIAEATLFVSGSPSQGLPIVGRWKLLDDNQVVSVDTLLSVEENADQRDWVSSGSAQPDTDIRIVDPDQLEEVVERTIGEIWVAGPQVASRYWSAEIPFGTLATSLMSEAHYLRTGDLGFLSEGQLYITGRLKDLIIWNGRNIAPHDIEQLAVEANRRVTAGYLAAFSLDDQAENQVILVIGQRKGISAQAANEIRQDVVRHVVQNLEVALEQIVFVPRSEIERTSSGKVRRSAIRAAFVEGRLTSLFAQPVIQHRHDAEETSCAGQEKLFALLTELEGLDQTQGDIAKQIDLSQPLPVAGYDSLKLLLLSGLIEEQYNTAPPYEFFYESSAGTLANWLAPRQPKAIVKQDHVSSLSQVPFSREQAALYFFEEDDWRAVVLLPLVLPSQHSTDEIVLQRFKRLIELHPILSTRLKIAQGSPVFDFKLGKNQDVQELVEFVEASPGDDMRQIEQDLWMRASAPLDMRHDAPIRLVVGPDKAGKRGIVFAVNHLVCDGRSLAIIIGDFFSEEETQETVNADVTAHYALISEEEAHLCSVNFKTALRYWQDMLSHVPAEISVPWPHVQVDRASYGPMPVRRFAIPEAICTAVKELVVNLGVGETSVYLSAWQLTLVQMGVAAPCAVSITQAAKSRVQQGAGIGYGVRPTPILMDGIDPQAQFCDLVQKVQHHILGALNHDAAPYPKIIEHLDVARGGRYAPFMQFQFGYARYPISLCETMEGACASDCADPMAFLLAQMHHIAQANLQVFEGANACAAMLVYDPQTVHEQTAKSLESVFLKTLTALLNKPQDRISQTALWPFTSIKGPVVGSSRPFTPVHMLARRQAGTHPDGLALIEENKHISNDHLWDEADRLSGVLQSRMAGKRGVIATYLPRSKDLVVAQIAILQSGNTCLPIDIKTPSARVLEMLGDAQTALVVTREDIFEEALRGYNWLDCKTPVQEDRAFEPVTVAEEDAAIIIYTSGSTGRAKGVVFPHGALSCRITDLCALMDVQAGDRVLAYVSPGADPSIQEYWMALTQGAALVIAPQGHGFDPQGVVEIMAREKVTHGVGLPVMLHALVDQPAYRDCHAFKALTCGGELLTQILRDKVTQGHKVRLINVYGATETTICATTFDVTQQPGDRVSAVGFPMEDTEVIICNDTLQPMPTGVVGEILIGGLSLSHGYIGNPQETEKRFVILQSDDTEKCFYRTGDLGWLDETGLLRFAGRLDHQVKISGYRVEPDEIALRLSALVGVRDAFVCAQATEDGEGQELLAYAVLEAGSRLTRLDLKRELDRVLPPPLRPAAYMFMEKFPMTTNGKVDRKALPKPQGEDRFGLHLDAQSISLEGDALVYATSPLEKSLMAFWAQALGVEEIKPFDNFFELGGHSLLAFQIVSKIEDSIGIHIPANTLYRAPTIRELGAEISRLLKEKQSADVSPALHPFRRDGKLIPLFIVSPGISGDVAIERLWPHLDNQRPIYRLSYPALGEDTEYMDLSALVSVYVDAISTVVSEESVYMAGYSTGGIVAYETAQAVQKSGIEVRGLILLDSLDVKGSAYGYHVLRFLKKHPLLMRCFEGLKLGRSVQNLLHDKRLLRQMGMMTSYQPRAWNGRVAFLKCRGNMWLHKRRGNLWRKQCPSMEVFDVEGDHSSVFQDGNVQKLAKKMIEIMQLWGK